jgi:drug/metabolite transporter (DMT)-like permease
MVIGILAGLGAGALWGLVFIAPRMLPQLSAVDIAAGRFVTYGLLSAVLLALGGRKQIRPTGAQLINVVVLSVLGFTAYFTWLALSIQLSGTEVPALVIGTVPLWVMLLGKPDNITWRKLLPGLVATAGGLALMTWAVHPGVAVITSEPTAAVPGLSAFWQGVLWVSLATLSWTIFSISNAKVLVRHPEIDAQRWANWLGIATGMGAVLMWLALGSDIQTISRIDNIPFVLFVLVASGVGSAWLATILWNVASQRLSASLCGQMIVSETLFALVYSYLWDGTWPSAVHLAAAGLFVIGIMASIRAHR